MWRRSVRFRVVVAGFWLKGDDEIPRSRWTDGFINALGEYFKLFVFFLLRWRASETVHRIWADHRLLLFSRNQPGFLLWNAAIIRFKLRHESLAFYLCKSSSAVIWTGLVSLLLDASFHLKNTELSSNTRVKHLCNLNYRMNILHKLKYKSIHWKRLNTSSISVKYFS